MSEERVMILKMLNEGKITVEEADALLDALSKAGADTPESESEFQVEEEGRGHPNEDSEREQQRERPFGDFRFDLSGLASGLNDVMREVGDSVRSAMQGIKDIDFEREFSRAFGRAKAHQEREMTVETAEATVVRLRNDWGDLHVRGSDTDAVLIQASLTVWAQSEEEAAALADSVQIAAEVSGDTLEISPNKPTGVQRVRVDYRIHVPRSMNLELSSASGPLDVGSMDATMQFSGLSGDITLEDLSGKGEFRTKSGDVTARNLRGDFTLGTLSGDVEIDGVQGSVSSESKSGDITARGASGDLALKTLSGDVVADLVAFSDNRVQLKSFSGDVELTVPISADATIVAETKSGDVECDLPLQLSSHSRKKLSGTLNAGGGSIVLESLSGDVEIEGR